MSLAVICHLHFWQNYLDLLHATAVTWGKGVGTDTEIKVFSSDLKCWGAWDTTCECKAKGITTINCLEERGVERGSTRWSSLKGWKRATVNQTNIRTVSKVLLGKLLRDGVDTGFSECIDTILNRTETELKRKLQPTVRLKFRNTRTMSSRQKHTWHPLDRYT